ncbi:MAG: tetratricopeptide repeat protein [Mariniblastus sp.]
MSLNIKHYVAIALGICVIGAYFVNQASKSNKSQPVAMNSTSEFMPLSKFEPTAQAPANLDMLSKADAFPKSENLFPSNDSPASADSDLSAPMDSKFESTSTDMPSYEMSTTDTYETAATQLTRPEPAIEPDNSLELSPVVMDDEEFDFDQMEIEMAELPLSGEFANDETTALSAEISTDQQNTVSQTALAQPESEPQPISNATQQAVLPVVRQKYEQAGSGWSKNPFASESGQATGKPTGLPTNSTFIETNGKSRIQTNKFVTDSTSQLPPEMNAANETTDTPVHQVAQRQSNQVRSLNTFPRSEQSTPAMPAKSILSHGGGEYQATETQRVEPQSSPVTTPTNSSNDESSFDFGSSSDSMDVGVAPVSMAISESAAQQAVHHIEYGKSLSRRGASFAAKQEFYSALRVIARANDANIGGTNFSEALGRAILIMKEAEDFVVKNPASEVSLDVTRVIDSHRSDVVTLEQAATLTPAEAMQKYYTVAEEQLDFAGGRNVVASEAFFCLGKLQTALMRTQTVPGQLDAAQSIVFHQVALNSNSNHHRSANELGVLLAQTGQLKRATKLFKQSLKAQPTTQAWQNLAKTHTRLGEQNLAQLAQSEAFVASQVQVANSSAGIQWMPTTQFNASAPLEYQDRVASKTALPLPSVPEKKAETDTEKKQDPKSLSERIKDLF